MFTQNVVCLASLLCPMLIILRSLRGKYSQCNRFLRIDGFSASIRSPYFVVRLFVFSLNLAVGGKLTQKWFEGPCPCPCLRPCPCLCLKMKVEQGLCHLMSPIMTLTKAYSMREKKTKRVHEDMNISIACRKTGLSIQLIATKNMTRQIMKGTLIFCFLTNIT